MLEVAVVGAGAAGLMAAIAAAQHGAAVTLLERNDRPGRKLLLTGGGRCNITNLSAPEVFVANVPGNGRFLYPALNAFSSADLLELLASGGVEPAVEPDGRVFPRSNRAGEVLQALTSLLTEAGATIRRDARVSTIVPEPGGFRLQLMDGPVVRAQRVIVATGGLSYSATGSTGDGLTWARELGHRVITPLPSLVGLHVREAWAKSIPGVALRGVTVSLAGTARPECGDVLFTHYGVSGPPVLTLSRYAARVLVDRERRADARVPTESPGVAASPHGLALAIATDPSLSQADWEARVEGEMARNPRRTPISLLSTWWPKALAEAVLAETVLSEGLSRPAHGHPRDVGQVLARLLHRLELTVIGTRPIEEAIVTQGGVDTRQVDPRTMSSKLVPGLFFAGEVLDVDGFSGGYNLQAAFSTGYLAGRSAARE